jgi:general secretion pathway protein G
MLELLAVVAIIATLIGILVPTLGAARASACRARTRVLFSQWSAAMEQYRLEYGCYPSLGTDGKLATPADTLQFVRTLAGTNPDGSPVADVAELNGNTKRRCFCSFAAGDFFDPDRPGGAADFSGNEVLCDGFGNTEIGVLVDRNGDGFIKPADDGPVAAVNGTGGRSYSPDETSLPPTGVRTGVAFFSAGRDAGPQDLVLSWQ